MIEIWNALDSWQRFEVVVLTGVIVAGIVAQLILSRDMRRWRK